MMYGMFINVKNNTRKEISLSEIFEKFKHDIIRYLDIDPEEVYYYLPDCTKDITEKLTCEDKKRAIEYYITSFLKRNKNNLLKKLGCYEGGLIILTKNSAGFWDSIKLIPYEETSEVKGLSIDFTNCD